MPGDRRSLAAEPASQAGLFFSAGVRAQRKEVCCSNFKLPHLAFTLIELLVVIAIIGILAALLLPVMNSAKLRAQGIQCLGNLRQLTLGWQLYTDDNSGRFPPNAATGGNHPAVGEDAANPSWVAGCMNLEQGLNASGVDDNTNTAKLIGSAYNAFGSIGNYIKMSGVYHCPGDFSLDPASGQPAVRSVSMNGWMNPGNTNMCDATYWSQSFKKFTGPASFSHTSPANIFVFLDERFQSINDGWFWINVDGYNTDGSVNQDNLEVNDLPAVYHNRASAFSFADAHCALQRWRSADFDNDEDRTWLMTHATVPE